MSATITAQQHQAAQNGNAEWLRYAVSNPKPSIQGSIASGSSGGSSSPVVWARVLPVVPRWVEQIEVFFALPYTLTIPAGATVFVSPFAPWSGLQQKLTIAGSPPWDFNSLVPLWLDVITRTRNYDPGHIGPLGGASPGTSVAGFVTAAQSDQGTWGFQIEDTGGFFVPGQSIHNTGAAAQVISGTIRGWMPIQLQRRPGTAFGMIPDGSSDDRPDLEMYLSNLVGSQPENSLVQDPNNSGATMVLSAAGTVYVIWRSKGLDILPAGIQPPNPIVGLGWQINSFTTSAQNAGQIYDITHRTAMLYQKIIQILYTNQQVIDSDYFAVWLTGEQQNARWEYDASQNNMQSYWKMVQERYRRYLPIGVFVADFISGDNPEIPSETPYDGVMSPDQTYADAFGVPYTPAMETATRFPSGTTMTQGTIRTYSYGYVEVPY